MRVTFPVPLWLSIIGYVLFFAMIIGFTVFLPWIVPVSLIIGAFIIGLLAWGVHKRRVNLLVGIVMSAVAAIFFILAFRGFVLFVETQPEGKGFLIAGILGLAIIFFGRRRKEIEEFEKFIGFQTPLRGLRKNSLYLAGPILDLGKILSRIYHPKPKSRLSTRKKILRK